MICNINYKNAHFILSTPNIYQLPIDNVTEFAFIGRSNSGKSSTINLLTNQKIAKVSKEPGCTKLINLFQISSKIRLIDFPGYGHTTTISKKIKKEWKKTLNQYLINRKNLNGIILITDIRYPTNKIDQKIIKQIKKNKIPILILLNKSDKISNYTALIKLQEIKNNTFYKNIKIIIFSTKKLKGIIELKKTINLWHHKNIKNEKK